MKNFFHKNWSNILFFGIIVLLIFPQTRVPIQVFVTRLISFSPSETAQEDQQLINSLDWSLVTIEGESINLASSEGNVILINLWATWCPPCIAEMPSLQNLYNDYKYSVDFYFPSSEEKEILQMFLQKKGYTFPVYRFNEQPPLQLQSQSIPATFVISKKGEIVIKKIGPADWDSEKVRGILDRLVAE
ncbi:TlpA family protein disulfide reductase [Jejudonia soesokkakensis]|uniref:TlpA family protein disulfide reductase n=1 Tax=Jejudonia soesokkakensis TaxID=1323432 RepID=A0ABW2MTG2_9FLAO